MKETFDKNEEKDKLRKESLRKRGLVEGIDIPVTEKFFDENLVQRNGNAEGFIELNDVSSPRYSLFVEFLSLDC